MKHLVSQTLHSYWDDLRAGRTAPERADVDPAAIRHILAYTFILEVAGGPLRRRDVRFRLAGTRLNALFGRDLRGTPFADVLAPGGTLTDALLDGLFDARTPVLAAARGGPPGWDAVDLELLLLPLRHHDRTQARVLGSLAAAGHPTWMGLRATAPLDVLRLDAVPGLAPAGSTAGAVPARLRAPVPDLRAAAVPPAREGGRPTMRPPLRKARFRIVEGGRSDARPGPC